MGPSPVVLTLRVALLVPHGFPPGALGQNRLGGVLPPRDPPRGCRTAFGALAGPQPTPNASGGSCSAAPHRRVRSRHPRR